MVQNIQRYISQLGMMVIAVGLSSYNVALFHLVNHAFYKALLFLGAGAVIHAVADNQDFRKYGGLISFLPLSYSVMLIASLSLVAFPFMTGFYSKDFILESAYGQFNFSSVAVYFIATIGAMFTTLYSVKVLYLTFLTNANGPLINYKRAHEGDVFMSLPLIILAVFSIFFGYITKDMFIGMASGLFSDNSLFTHPLHEIMLETEFAVPTLFKLLPFFLTVTLSALSLILSEFLCKSLIYFKLTRMGYNIFSFFNQRLLIELFYNKYITCFILNLGGQTTKVLDKGSIELLGPYGLEKGLLRLSKTLSSLDTGVITSYALYIFIGLILYILIPSISLKDISILLCILLGVLNISINTLYIGVTNSIPHPYTLTSLPIQSHLYLGIGLVGFSVSVITNAIQNLHSVRSHLLEINWSSIYSYLIEHIYLAVYSITIQDLFLPGLILGCGVYIGISIFILVSEGRISVASLLNKTEAGSSQKLRTDNKVNSEDNRTCVDVTYVPYETPQTNQPRKVLVDLLDSTGVNIRQLWTQRSYRTVTLPVQGVNRVGIILPDTPPMADEARYAAGRNGVWAVAPSNTGRFRLTTRGYRFETYTIRADGVQNYSGSTRKSFIR